MVKLQKDMDFTSNTQRKRALLGTKVISRISKETVHLILFLVIVEVRVKNQHKFMNTLNSWFQTVTIWKFLEEGTTLGTGGQQLETNFDIYG